LPARQRADREAVSTQRTTTVTPSVTGSGTGSARSIRARGSPFSDPHLAVGGRRSLPARTGWKLRAHHPRSAFPSPVLTCTTHSGQRATDGHVRGYPRHDLVGHQVASGSRPPLQRLLADGVHELPAPAQRGVDPAVDEDGDRWAAARPPRPTRRPAPRQGRRAGRRVHRRSRTRPRT